MKKQWESRESHERTTKKDKKTAPNTHKNKTTKTKLNTKTKTKKQKTTHKGKKQTNTTQTKQKTYLNLTYPISTIIC